MSKNKLNYKKTIFIGMAFLGISAFWQLYDIIIPLILENTFGLNKTITGFVMSIDNILALLLLPVFGSLSDKLNSKHGKRTPFIFVGTIICVVGILIIPYANNESLFILFNIGLAIVLIGSAIYRAPAVALMPDLTQKSLRSKANAIINLMGALGAIIALIAIRFLVESTNSPNYFPVFSAIAIVMIISFILLYFNINENKMRLKEVDTQSYIISEGKKMPKDMFRSLVFILLSIFFWFAAYNGITTAYSRYAINMWDMNEASVASSLMVATVVAVFSFIPAGIIASKIGRKKTILLGIALVSTTYIMGSILVEFSFLIYIAFALMGIGWAFINVNSFPIVVEMSKSGDIGKFTGTYYTASMSAQIVTPILSGFLMDQFGYRILFPYALVFSILSFITMLKVKHGDSEVDLSSKLELFDTED